MHTLARNTKKIAYALYSGSTESKDSDGQYTGEHEITYASPVFVRMNVSASRGSAEYEPFGIETNYTKIMVTDDMSCPIDEHSILWVENASALENDPTTPHDYIVVRVAKSLNHITYAIREVKVA